MVPEGSMQANKEVMYSTVQHSYNTNESWQQATWHNNPNGAEASL